MEGMDIIMLTWIGAMALIGLFLVFLQKKGIIKPEKIVISSRSLKPIRGFNGGFVVFFSILWGVSILIKYSIIGAVIYLCVITGVYILIKVK